MWSIADPPNEVFDCDQISDIEDKFNIEFTENDAMLFYDMNFEEAVIFIKKIIKLSKKLS